MSKNIYIRIYPSSEKDLDKLLEECFEALTDSYFKARIRIVTGQVGLLGVEKSNIKKRDKGGL